MAALPPVNLGMVTTTDVRKATKAAAGIEFTCVLTEDGQVGLLPAATKEHASARTTLVNLRLPAGDREPMSPSVAVTKMTGRAGHERIPV